MPFDSLVVIGNKVILSVYGYKFYRFAKYFQRIEKLDTFADRYIRIYRTVKQQQWSVDFVGVEQRALLGE